jgi:hypothetical protein
MVVVEYNARHLLRLTLMNNVRANGARASAKRRAAPILVYSTMSPPLHPLFDTFDSALP